MNKALQIISWITIALALGVILVITYWLIYPYEPITFSQPHRILTPEINQGEHLVYEVDYCKNTTVTPIVTRTFVDGIIYSVPEIVATNKEIGCRVQVVQMYVPKALPSGDYHIEINYKYKVNPIRDITVTTVTDNFTIR